MVKKMSVLSLCGLFVKWLGCLWGNGGAGSGVRWGMGSHYAKYDYPFSCLDDGEAVAFYKIKLGCVFFLNFPCDIQNNY